MAIFHSDVNLPYVGYAQKSHEKPICVRLCYTKSTTCPGDLGVEWCGSHLRPEGDAGCVPPMCMHQLAEVGTSATSRGYNYRPGSEEMSVKKGISEIW